MADQHTVKEYMRMKGSDLIVGLLEDLKDVFGPNTHFEESKRIVHQQFLGKVIDDLLDFREDYDLQPNLFIAIAQEYPSEWEAIKRHLDTGGSFNSFKGLLLLYKIAPRQ